MQSEWTRGACSTRPDVRKGAGCGPSHFRRPVVGFGGLRWRSLLRRTRRVDRQLLMKPEELESRARSLAERLSKATGIAMGSENTPGFEVRTDRGFAGGGSLPGFELDSWVVSLRVQKGSPQRIASRLRGARVPVLARVRDGALLFDPRTLRDDEIPDLESSLLESLG